ncbi:MULTISPECIES: hypothetical protein [unclassified Microcoleus]|uniref:hypothetical protein n=1 Tax=unclassified Microcoleus TaxID=2642155 RepID=UPI0025D15789|nr:MULTISPECIES: hypothetical protein [unclassified Microcoleus]
MADNSLSGTRSFRRQITAADGTNIIEILKCSDIFNEFSSLESSYFIGRSFYLEALSGATYLPSKKEAPFPQTFPEMNAAEKIAALLEVEKKYPFIGLRLHARKGSGAWQALATSLLQNRGRETTIPLVIPYLTVNQIKLLSPDDSLGVSIVNYGHGTLMSGDYINLEGDFRFSLDLIEKPKARAIGVAQPYGIDVSTAVRFRTANPNRALLYVTNAGESRVWLAGTASGLAVGSGIFLSPGGGSLSLTDAPMLTGELWAIAENGTSRLAGMEASYA